MYDVRGWYLLSKAMKYLYDKKIIEYFSQKEPLKIHWGAFFLKRKEFLKYIPEYKTRFETTSDNFDQILIEETKWLEPDIIIEYEETIVIIEAAITGKGEELPIYHYPEPPIEEEYNGFISRYSYCTRLILYRDILEKFTGKTVVLLFLSFIPGKAGLFDRNNLKKFKKAHNELTNEVTKCVEGYGKYLSALNFDLGLTSSYDIGFYNVYHQAVTYDLSEIAFRAVVPNERGYKKSENDHEIISEYLVIKMGPGFMNAKKAEVWVRLISWPQPWRSENSLKKLPNIKYPFSHIYTLPNAVNRILNNPRYFKICAICGLRKPKGNMFSSDICQGCATDKFGVIY